MFRVRAHPVLKTCCVVVTSFAGRCAGFTLCFFFAIGVVFLARFSSNWNRGSAELDSFVTVAVTLLLATPPVPPPSPTNNNHAAPDCFPKLTALFTNADTSVSSWSIWPASRWCANDGFTSNTAGTGASAVDDTGIGFGLGRLRGRSIATGSRFGLSASTDTADTCVTFARLACPGLINGFRGPPASALDGPRTLVDVAVGFFLLLTVPATLLILPVYAAEGKSVNHPGDLPTTFRFFDSTGNAFFASILGRSVRCSGRVSAVSAGRRMCVPITTVSSYLDPWKKKKGKKKTPNFDVKIYIGACAFAAACWGWEKEAQRSTLINGGNELGSHLYSVRKHFLPIRCNGLQPVVDSHLLYQNSHLWL